MAAQRTLRLLIPRLLGPLPAGAASGAADLPALSLLLARGRPLAGPAGGFAAAVQAQFGRVGEAASGPLALLGEGGDPGAAHWMQADPVHLRADRDRVMLFAEPELAAAEAAAIINEFNRFFAADGLELHAPHPERWYLRFEHPLDLETYPTGSVSGRYLDPFMPRGADARRWSSLQSEMQMLLHASPVNRDREAQGKPIINGIWCWGGGRLPERVESPWGGVYASAPLALGLAHRGGLTPQPAAPAREWQWPALVVLDAPERALAASDLGGWEAALAQIEGEWLEPLLGALRAGRLDSLELLVGERGWRLDRAALRRFWRRVRPWHHHLGTE